ncbi:MAG: hypothetical protein IPP55_03810 [Anaerolineales bacterium]|nr:hypothetical protein [Anaerolineales bacterium]
MRKTLFIILAFVLAACGTAQPAQQLEPPTPIVQTVVVVATTQAAPPTAISLPTQGPTNTPLPTETATALPPTAVPPTAIPPTSAPPTAGSSNTSAPASDLIPVNIDNILGKGVFVDIAFTSNRITLNCYPREFNISMKALHPDVTRAEMFYRVVEAPTYFRLSDWYLVGNMDTDGKGTFFITFKATDIIDDWRVLDHAVIDFQFVGVNKGGGVVDRTQKIERFVDYYKNCP